jgi:hypothetical protein
MTARALTAAFVIFFGVDSSPWEGPLEAPVTASRPAERVAVAVTQVTSSAPSETPTALTSLCHAEAVNALEVSSAIESHLPAGVWYRMCRVAWCESRFDPAATNGPHVGVWQINRRLWGGLGFDLRDIDGATRAAAAILERQGIRAWTCAQWN